MSHTIKLYDRDFYTWTKEQADLVRRHQFVQLDVIKSVAWVERSATRG